MAKNEIPTLSDLFRERFFIDDPETAYLDGNSLGRLPLATRDILNQVIQEQWGRELIRSWNQHWLPLTLRIREKIAKLIGAETDEVLVGDSTSVNLFKLAQACLDTFAPGSKVLSDSTNFPSDLYILQGLCARTSGRVVLNQFDMSHCSTEEIENSLVQQMTQSTKLVVLSHVHYQSGYLFSMERLNSRAREIGAKVIWDVSHSVGALPIDVRKSDCDMLVGCCYKYLNGGPGAPAFLYLRRELQSQLRNPIQGWFGAADPFAFSDIYQPQHGIEQFAVGAPCVLSMAAIEPGVDLVLEAGVAQIRTRSLELTDRFIEGLESIPNEFGYSLVTPRGKDYRGSHVSVRHEHSWQITQSLIHDFKVIPDYREPSMIRFGITPLYTNETDIERAVTALRRAIGERTYENYSREKRGVT